MRISHCILNSIEWDLCETSKGKSLWAEMATFPKFLIRQSTLYFLPFLKLQIKWLRSWPYKSIYHKCRQCHYWEWIIYHWPRLRDIPNAHNHWFIFIFIMCEDPHEYKSIQIAFGSGPGRIMASHYTWEFMTTLHDFEGVLGRPLDTFFWTLKPSWLRLLARVWSDPNCLTRLKEVLRSPPWTKEFSFCKETRESNCLHQVYSMLYHFEPLWIVD